MIKYCVLPVYTNSYACDMENIYTQHYTRSCFETPAMPREQCSKTLLRCGKKCRGDLRAKQIFFYSFENKVENLIQTSCSNIDFLRKRFIAGFFILETCKPHVYLFYNTILASELWKNEKKNQNASRKIDWQKSFKITWKIWRKVISSLL